MAHAFMSHVTYIQTSHVTCRLKEYGAFLIEKVGALLTGYMALFTHLAGASASMGCF